MRSLACTYRFTSIGTWSFPGRWSKVIALRDPREEMVCRSRMMCGRYWNAVGFPSHGTARESRTYYVTWRNIRRLGCPLLVSHLLTFGLWSIHKFSDQNTTASADATGVSSPSRTASSQPTETFKRGDFAGTANKVRRESPPPRFRYRFDAFCSPL